MTKLMSIFTSDYDDGWLFIDCSAIKAQQHSTGAASFNDESICKSVAGNSTKLYLMVVDCYDPISIEATGGYVLNLKWLLY